MVALFLLIALLISINIGITGCTSEEAVIPTSSPEFPTATPVVETEPSVEMTPEPTAEPTSESDNPAVETKPSATVTPEPAPEPTVVVPDIEWLHSQLNQASGYIVKIIDKYPITGITNFHSFRYGYGLVDYYMVATMSGSGDALVGSIFDDVEAVFQNQANIEDDVTFGQLRFFVDLIVDNVERQIDNSQSNEDGSVRYATYSMTDVTDAQIQDMVKEIKETHEQYRGYLTAVLDLLSEPQDQLKQYSALFPIGQPDKSLADSYDREQFTNPIVYLSKGGTRISNIYIMNGDGTGPTTLIKDIDPGDPVCSPDGNLMAFVSDRSGNEEIYIVDLDNATVKRLTYNAYADRDPCWSPDGKAIAFSSLRNCGEDIIAVQDNLKSRFWMGLSHSELNAYE